MWERDTQIVQLYKQQSAIFMGEDNSMNALHLNYFYHVQFLCLSNNFLYFGILDQFENLIKAMDSLLMKKITYLPKEKKLLIISEGSGSSTIPSVDPG